METVLRILCCDLPRARALWYPPQFPVSHAASRVDRRCSAVRVTGVRGVGRHVLCLTPCLVCARPNDRLMQVFCVRLGQARPSRAVRQLGCLRCMFSLQHFPLKGGLLDPSPILSPGGSVLPCRRPFRPTSALFWCFLLASHS